MLLFFLAGFLFAFGFHLFRPGLPGGNARAKAFRYGMLIGLGIYFGNSVDFMAFDPAGAADPFSAYKIEHIVTAACDALNFLINGWLLGLVAAASFSSTDSGPSAPRLDWRPSLAGLFLLPIAGFLAWTLWTPVFGVEYLVPPGQETRFHLMFWIPLGLTCGVVVPLMYQIADPLLSGGRLIRAGAFTLLHFALYWVTLTAFVVPVSGMMWRDVFFFFAIALPVIFLISLPAAWLKRT